MAALATHKAASLGQIQRAQRLAFEFLSCYRTTSTAATGHVVASYGISGSQKWLRKCLFNPAIDYNIGQTPLNTLRKCNNFLATGFPRWLLGFYRHFLTYKKCHTCREACSESGELGHIVWQASAAEWWRKSVGREVFPFAQASNEDIWRNRAQLAGMGLRRAHFITVFCWVANCPKWSATLGASVWRQLWLVWLAWRRGEGVFALVVNRMTWSLCQTEIWQLGGSKNEDF